MGLELKREILVGELASLRDAALPVVAAVGGMVVPALIYAALNAGGAHASGWGIPTATDIAFADDLGAVLVIAIFYTSGISLAALGVAAALFALLVFFNRGGIRHPLPYALVGCGLWYALLASGIHATLAGILLASLVSAAIGLAWLWLAAPRAPRP